MARSPKRTFEILSDCRRRTSVWGHEFTLPFEDAFAVLAVKKNQSACEKSANVPTRVAVWILGISSGLLSTHDGSYRQSLSDCCLAMRRDRDSN